MAQQQQQTAIIPIAYATTSSEGEDCSTIPASDPDLEGWTIETCGNGEQTWIKPDGTRCVANEAASTTACEDSIPMQVR